MASCKRLTCTAGWPSSHRSLHLHMGYSGSRLGSAKRNPAAFLHTSRLQGAVTYCTGLPLSLSPSRSMLIERE